MIALLAFLTVNADAGVLLAGGITAAPSSQAQALTGVPTLRFGVGSDQFHVWTAARVVRYHLDKPDFTGLAIEPHLGVRYAFQEPTPGSVVPLATASTYTRMWAISGEDIDQEDIQPDKGSGIRPVIGATAAGGLEAILSANLSVSAELGVDYFTAGYLYDGWVTHLGVLTTYGALYVNIRL